MCVADDFLLHAFTPVIQVSRNLVTCYIPSLVTTTSAVEAVGDCDPFLDVLCLCA